MRAEARKGCDMARRRMRLWDNGNECVAARSAREAAHIVAEAMGGWPDESEGFALYAGGDLCARLTVTVAGHHASARRTHTVASWIARFPRGGVVCSADWP